MFLTEKALQDFLKQAIKSALEEQMENQDNNKGQSGDVMQRYLTRKQVACYLGISLSTVDLWSRTGKLRKIPYHGSVRFDKEVIDSNIEELGKYGMKRAEV